MKNATKIPHSETISVKAHNIPLLMKVKKKRYNLLGIR